MYKRGIMKKIILSLTAVAFMFCADATEQYKIKGMYCNYGCVNKVKSVMNSLEGVKSCEVDFDKSLMTIQYDDSKINSDLIISSIEGNTTFEACKCNPENKKSFWSKIKGIFNKKS